MIKIGDFVRIKSLSEIKKLDIEEHLSLPTERAEQYYGKYGIVRKVSKFDDHIYRIIVKNMDYVWFSTEVEVLDTELFIYLDSFIQFQYVF